MGRKNSISKYLCWPPENRQPAHQPTGPPPTGNLPVVRRASPSLSLPSLRPTAIRTDESSSFSPIRLVQLAALLASRY